MKEAQAMVREFHRKFGSTVGEYPEIRDPELSVDLIAEEVSETIHAIREGDFVEAIDGICDSIYVLLGAAVRMGIEIEPFFVEVHRSNMAKEGGTTRADGKILKPEGWEPPAIRHILNAQTWKGRNH